MAVKEEAGLSQGTIAVSAFRAYRNAFQGGDDEPAGDKKPDWDDLDDDQQVAWFSVTERALDILEECDDLPWVSLATSLFSVWARRSDYPIQEFSELAMPVRAAWVAVSRHITNLCSLEGPEDLAPHEQRWIGAANRLGKAAE